MHERIVAFADETARVAIDTATGEFPAVLASDGEASDGDILSIEGARFGRHLPLQISHANDPRMTAGSILKLRRDLRSSPKKLRGRGRIEVEGDGQPAEVRRDLAFMISRGHITHMSIRWDPIRWRRRINLPSDHPAFVSEEETDFRKRFGLFFEQWRALEGSIVAVPADMEAVIGRADETRGAVSEFWRAVAQDLESGDEVPLLTRLARYAAQAEASGVPLAERINAVVLGEAAAELEPVEVEAEGTTYRLFLPPALGALVERAASEDAAPDANADPSEPGSARESDSDPEPDPELSATPQGSDLAESERALQDALNKIDALSQQVSALEGRVSGEPAPPKLRTTRDMLEYIERRSDEAYAKGMALARAFVDMRRGRVNPDQNVRQKMHAEIEALIQELRERASPPPTETHDIQDLLTKAQERARQQVQAEAEGRDAETREKLQGLAREIESLGRDWGMQAELEAIRAKASAPGFSIEDLRDLLTRAYTRIRQQMQAETENRDTETRAKLERLADELEAIGRDRTLQSELEAIRAQARESSTPVDVDRLVSQFSDKLEKARQRARATFAAEAARRAEENDNV